MTKKEIVFVTEHLTNGGAERVMSELTDYFCRVGNDVTVIQIRPYLHNESYPISEGIRVISINSTSKVRFIRRIQDVIALVRLLKKRKNAAVLAFVNPAILAVGISSLFLRNKVIFSERNDPNNSPPKKMQRLVRDIVFNFADICVFQTEDAMNHFSKRIKSRGVIIPNPINSNLPERYHGTRRTTIITASRLQPQKNLPMLIRAFYRLSGEFPEYNLEIYGQGPEHESLQKLICELNMQDRIFLKGFCNNIYEKMLDCAMYVSPSDYEGISNSMLEALGMGIPTISTDCPVGGARMVIKNGHNGILIPVGDENELYLSMKKIIEEPEFADMISEEAYKIRNDFSIDRIAAKWLDII